MISIEKIALGGGCHWCTEAVFQSLKGVEKVAQGFVSATAENSAFSEAVIVHFNPKEISLKLLIEIHLLTHKSTSNHSMRKKYRSAIYYFNEIQKDKVSQLITVLQPKFDHKIITRVLAFSSFKPSPKEFQNYYYSNPKKPFCQTYINPKLQLLLKKFSSHVKS